MLGNDLFDETGIDEVAVVANAAAVEGDHVEVGHLLRTHRHQIRQDQLVSFSHGLFSLSDAPADRYSFSAANSVGSASFSRLDQTRETSLSVLFSSV